MSEVLRRVFAIIFALIFGISTAACAGSDSSAGSGFALRTDQLVPTTSTVPKPSFLTVVAAATGPELEVFETIPTGDCETETTDTTVDSNGSTNSDSTTLPWIPTDGVCRTEGDTTTDTTSTTAPPADPSENGTETTTITHAPIPRIGLNSAGSSRTGSGWIYANPTFFENPLVMVVTEEDGDWLKVMIPSRPKETEGWVRASDVTLSEHRFHMQLTLSNFTLRAWEGDDLIAETQVVIGTDHTRTPTGHFYITEKIPQSYTGGAYGPWILPTNAYSEDLDLFDGGLPVVAFHGTNQPALVGTQASNGCVRMPNEVIEQLAAVIPAGTPVDIVP